MKIVLLGYMASGKSAVGKSLSSKLFLPFIDLDQHISGKEHASITEIFKTKGEIYFRKVEHQYLKELLSSEDKFILSLGGGTPCYANNMNLIKNNANTVSIYLEATVNTLTNRLKEAKSKRPLIAGLADEKISEFVAKHLFERRGFYREANHIVDVNDKSLIDIVTEIRILLH